jgi:hypothetical protein
MNRDDLSKEQAETLLVTVRPMLNFLYRLVHRMDKVGFTSTDPLYGAACKAYDGVHELHILLHYETASGAGRPPKPKHDLKDETAES